MQASVGLFKTMTGKERAGTQACNTSPIMTPSMQASSSPPADPLRINLASYLLLGSLFIMLYKGLHACCWLPIRRRHCSAPSLRPSLLPLALTRPAPLPGAALPPSRPPASFSVLLSFLLLPPCFFQEPRRTGRGRRSLAPPSSCVGFFSSFFFLRIRLIILVVITRHPFGIRALKYQEEALLGVALPLPFPPLPPFFPRLPRYSWLLTQPLELLIPNAPVSAP